ncbi:MAG: sulfotransferase, partial [Sedimenticolaceae bacterium]
RSGTTMLRLMLNAHPMISIPFETDFLHFDSRAESYGDLARRANRVRLIRDMARYPFIQKAGLIDDVDAAADQPAGSFADVVANLFSRHARHHGKIIWGDKTPSFVTELHRLHELFPHCRIVHIVRDGRDVALSLSKISWGSPHILRVAEDWRWKTILGHKVGRALGPAYHQVSYERLVMETKSTLCGICDFLGIDFADEMLDYAETARGQMPADSLRWHQSSVSSPDPHKVFMWKKAMKRGHRILFDEHAGDALDLFGYDRYQGPSTLSSKFLGLYYSVVKRW